MLTKYGALFAGSLCLLLGCGENTSSQNQPLGSGGAGASGGAGGSGAVGGTGGTAERPHPHMMYAPEHKQLIRDRITREPYATLWQRLKDRADEEWRESEEFEWESGVHTANGRVAEANAVIAWIEDDEAAAMKAREFLLGLRTDFEFNNDIDVNIRMPRVLMTHVNARDLLMDTPWFSEEDAQQSRELITEVNRKFATKYFENPIYTYAAFLVAQNNHPLRTASAIGYVGLAFPDDPDAERWMNWAAGEIDYLLGPNGKYVQADGGVSEGPFYFAFGMAAVIPFAIAHDRLAADAVYERTCFSRNDVDPWQDHGCVEGEEFTMRNPLRDDYLRKSFEWSVALRRPIGLRAQIDDTKEALLTGGALLTSFDHPGYLLWDWKNNGAKPLETQKFNELTAWHLAYAAEVEDESEPPFSNRFFEASGEAVFRSGWDQDAVWLALVADHDAARKTLHNHGDGTSFSLSAYGEDLLIDPGYYKPNPTNNPLTMNHPSHNVILIDGKGAPERGLLTDWGDTEAYLENWVDGTQLAYSEARMSYEETDFRRGVAFVGQRYFVIADRLETTVSTPRSYQWRAHLWAGYDAGGSYAYGDGYLQLERDQAGLDLFVHTSEGLPTFVEPEYTQLTPPHVHQLLESQSSAGDHAVADAVITGVSPEFLTVLAPFRSGGSKLVVQSLVPGDNAAAFAMGEGAATDFAWLRDDGAASTLTLATGAVVETDAELVVAAVDGSWALIAGGSNLTIDGQSVISGNTEPVAVVQ